MRQSLTSCFSMYSLKQEHSFLEQAIILEQKNRRKKKKTIKSVSLTLLFLLALSLILTFIPLAVFKIVNKNPTISAVDKQNFNYDIKTISEAEYVSSLDLSARRYLFAMINYISMEIIENSGIDSTTAKNLAFKIVTESLIAKEDPFFITSIILAESTFNPNAKSKVGALGLMQVMPRTGEYIAKIANYGWQGVASLKNPDTNLRLGISYVKYLKNEFKNDTHKILIAYNWGPTNLKKGKNPPKISINYSNKIQSNHKKWKSDFQKRIEEFKYKNVNSVLS